MAHAGDAERSERPPDGGKPGLLFAVGIGVALLVGSALYLIAVRGDALFLDLAGLSGLLFCF